MSKTTTPKWAVTATWRRYSLHRTKKEAEAALARWKQIAEAEGLTVTGSKGVGYRATGDLARSSATVVKLADHPLCYIGVLHSDVERLREMEEAGNPHFSAYAQAAKALSADWTCVEAL